ncbi:hypothetical protein [Streptomyces sp. NPDC058045]|uniref:hypothetical protein n=1 Tax=Streptomyces sp. NPDC058045 TaxID=3346311 RepID=UPI0036E9E2A4
MEQRKDLKIQPVQAASTDPAFISGLMPSGPEEQEETAAPKDAAAPAAEAEPESPKAEVPTDEGELAADEESAEESAEAGEDESADEHAFEAADRRGAVEMDRTGVRFRLDGEEADFRWDEIGAVEYETSRFGRRLTVTVHTAADRRWYPGEVQAPDKATLDRWTTALDAALDAYFDDGDEAEDQAADEADGTKAEAKAEDSAADEKADDKADDKAETETADSKA